MPLDPKLDPIIKDAAQQANIDENLLRAVLLQETGGTGSPNLTSKKGAQGIAQLMPGTAQYLGVSNPFDVSQAIPAAARYLAEGLAKAEKLGVQNPAEFAARYYNSGNGFGNTDPGYVGGVGNYYRQATQGPPGAPAAAAVQGVYGVPGAIMNYASTTGELGAPGSNLVTIKTPSGIPVQVNKGAADAFQGFLGDLEGTGYKINSLGGYAPRAKRGGSTISEHAYGNAIDINPESNPFKSSQTDLPPGIHDMAAKWGLVWGGDWTDPKDPMHLQWGGSKPWLPATPTDAVTAAATTNNLDPHYLMAVARAQSQFDLNNADAVNGLAADLNKNLSAGEAQQAQGSRISPSAYAVEQLGLSPGMVGRQYAAVKPPPPIPAPPQVAVTPPQAPGAPLAALAVPDTNLELPPFQLGGGPPPQLPQIGE